MSGEFDAAIDALVDRHLASPATGIVAIKSGVNRVFRMMAGNERVIVRLNDLAEIPRFRKEAWCIERAASVGVPGPKVLAVGTQGRYAYMLETDVPGLRGDELRQQEQLSTWQMLGALLRRLHAISLPGFGDELARMTTGGGEHWARYLAYNIDQLTPRDPLLEMGVLAKHEQNRLRTQFHALARTPLRFGLSHGDCSLVNAIVGDGGLTTIIDWGEAHAHVVPHYDIAVIQQVSLRDDSPGFAAMLHGYELEWSTYEAIRPEIVALRSLVATDKVRWARDRRPDRLAEKVKALRRELEPGGSRES